MKIRVLVADDDADLRMLVFLGLRRAGCEVTSAHDGTTALERCRAGVYDVAVLDVDMPGLTGLDVTRALRADRATAAMGVVLVSTLDSPADLARGHEAGADAYLPKPVDLTGLAETVRGLAARSDHSGQGC